MARWLQAMFVAAAVASAWATPSFADSSLQRVVAAKTLKVAVALNAPWVIRQPDGSYTGNDIELVQLLAQDMGVRATFVEVPFADLIPAVARGDVDMAVGGIAITPERALSAAFSTVTGAQEINIVADRKAVGKDPAKAMAAPGFRISALKQSTDAAAARAYFPKADIVEYPSAGAALAALIDGEVQAMAATAPVPRMAASLYDAKLRLVGDPIARAAEAFALRPDDERLRTYMNNWIAARTVDGTISQTGARWFDGRSWLRTAEGNVKAAPKP